MAQLKEVLQACLSPDAEQQTRALQWLDNAREQDLPGFMVALANAMATTTNDPNLRMMAGTQLKNCLDARTDVALDQKLEVWRTFPPHVRDNIKQCVLKTLGTESGASQAARVIAQIAMAEVEHKLWPDLMPSILGAIASPEATEAFRVAALETLGYICEKVDPDHLQEHADATLNAVVTCMRSPGMSNKVKKTATDALQNALEFCQGNFNRPDDRNHIMTVICETTQNADEQVKVAALQCLVAVMQEYYRYMGAYMAEALFGITMDAMGSDSDEDRVALQGIEFWSTVCDEELDLAADEESGAQVAFTDGTPTGSQHYARGALQQLAPRLLQLMERQEEHEDPSEWSVSKAACCCLDLLAQTVQDAVLEHVIPYVHQNLRHAAWQKRDTAVMAFGAVLDGPNEGTLQPLISEALPPLMELMRDPTPAVRDSLAWVLGRICDLLPNCVCGEMLVPVTQCLMAGLEMEPRVATNVCWAFAPLSEAAFNNAKDQSGGEQPASYGLSPALQEIVAKLLQTTERPDGKQENLRQAAYGALAEILRNIPQDCYPIFGAVIPVVLQRLQAAVQQAATATGKDAIIANGEIQSDCCSLLQAMVRQLKDTDAQQLAPSVMELLVGVLRGNTRETEGVQEDVLMLIGAIAEKLEQGFALYMDAVKPFIGQGLTNTEAVEVCKISVSLIGDFSRSLGPAVAPHCDDFMGGLLTALQNEEIDRSVKPAILSAFSDIALSIGINFVKYLEPCIQALNQASVVAAASVGSDDYDEIDDQNELRQGCADAYTGILCALKGDASQGQPSQVGLIMGYVPHIMEFLTQCVQDDNLLADETDTPVMQSVIGLVGDLISVFGEEMNQVLNLPFCEALIAKGLKKAKTKKYAKWCKKQLANIHIQVSA